MDAPNSLRRGPLLGGQASGSRPGQDAEERQFDARLHRLQALINDSAVQGRRLDAAVYRLSGQASPGQVGSDKAQPDPINVLSKLDLSIDYFEEIVKRTGEHLNRLETL